MPGLLSSTILLTSAIIASKTCAEKSPLTTRMCWMELANQRGCYVWNPSFTRNQTAAWTGGCDGTAHGTGAIILSVEGYHEIVTGHLDHGRREGPTDIRRTDGSSSEGPYEYGERHGTWILRGADGSSSEGLYEYGERRGTWILREADGTVEKGPYRDNKRNGNWILRFPDGNEMEGPYVDGLRHGVWTRHFADGAVEKGRYVNGEKQGTWIVRDGKFRYRTKYLDGRPKGKARDAIGW